MKLRSSVWRERGPLPDMKGVFEMLYSPTRSSTSRIRRVLLGESDGQTRTSAQFNSVYCILFVYSIQNLILSLGVFVLKLALSSLCQGLSFQETLSEAPLERILLSIRYVLILHHAV